jgi:hypothetical protein
VTSAAVPVKKTSSAMYNISRGIISSFIVYPKSCANCIAQRRVTPPARRRKAAGC